ncbi:WD40 repeat domain-containing protein [Streptomyces spectabilis]|uniref:WD40 repeat domain-containing protein n=1 Tax=Streptomyces spectabilis TaxID=68270 RepID=A0A516R5D5_STRST|nr:WD40 repeat domain-containing protein [Streptomyces spectabilis]QDQ10864.1 WD40 repeat domain-containing protein [Streptomyces spectabilis]
MNVEQLVRETLQEEAAASGTARGDLADRVLTARRRRNRRGAAGAVAVAAALVAAVVTVPEIGGDGEAASPASESINGDVVAHPDQSPPRDMIAAGGTAVSGYYAGRRVEQPGGDELFTRHYTVLDQKSGRYKALDTKWAWVDVAPGMRTAAVLEGELPARRIGMLDLITGKVERWIPVGRPVAGVEWSPDGKRLVATAYSKNPDRLIDRSGDHPANGAQPHGSRTGFYVVDAGSGEVGPFRTLRQSKPDKWGNYQGNSREDVGWGHDGTKLYVEQLKTGNGKSDHRAWYTPSGARTSAPAKERFAGWSRAGLSPDGKLVAVDGDSGGSWIVNSTTGEKVGLVPGMQPLAWADSKRLITIGCDPRKCGGRNEFRSQLMLVTVGSKKAVPLSGFRKASDTYLGRWEPLAAAR